jgi:hypothetical protein
MNDDSVVKFENLLKNEFEKTNVMNSTSIHQFIEKQTL